MSTLRLAGGCLMFSLFAGCVSIPAPASADVGISFDFFYSDLSPHGDWLVSASYGRVWQPAGYGTGWNPYYDGHWIYTDVGWTWVSDYEWGAVPYHYGTWVVDAELGWVWVPGYVWAPAWVVFRTGPDYIGWAPVPVDYSVGMSIGSAPYSPELFVFVASRDFLAPRVRTCAVAATDARVVVNHTRFENTIRIENNVVVNTGPDVNLVQRASGSRIEAESIERVPRVGPGRRVTRDDLRADAAGTGTRLRAADPISEKESEGVVGRGKKDKEPRPTAPEADRGQRPPRFSPSADPQMPPDADRRQGTEDRERGQDRAREQQARPDRQGRAGP